MKTKISILIRLIIFIFIAINVCSCGMILHVSNDRHDEKLLSSMDAPVTIIDKYLSLEVDVYILQDRFGRVLITSNSSLTELLTKNNKQVGDVVKNLDNTFLIVPNNLPNKNTTQNK